MRILITAGPTREFIDPVRFISNPSTGNMGYSLAEAAKKRKHKVTLISGPVSIKPPKGIKTISATTAEQMFESVKKHFKGADCLVMAAAVSDFKAKKISKNKLKKQNTATKKSIELVQNPDILSWAGKSKQKRVIVGFCMETRNLLKNARKKLKAKKADIIVANKIDKHNAAFGDSPTKISILQNGTTEQIGPISKRKIAQILLDKIERAWYPNG